MTPRLPAALGALALLLVTASPGAAASPGFAPGYRGFHSVLAYGSGQTANAADLAANLANDTVPASFTNQADLYNRVITKQPTGDLSGYYKDSSYADITGDSETIGGATIVRDTRFRVPHIYGPTRSSAMYAAGYATAEDRLFLMDALRRTAEGSTTELLGEEAVGDDSATLGQFDLSPEELTAEVMRLPQDEGAAGARALADLQQYVAGINAYIQAALLDPTLLPAEYAGLGTTPRAWTVADSAAEAYLLIAMFTVFGDGEHLQSDVLAKLQKKLGAKAGLAVYNDLRHLEDPNAPVTAEKPFPSDRPAAGPSSAVALDAGSLKQRNAVVSSSPGTPSVPLPVGAKNDWVRTLARGGGINLEHHASNALLVAGSHSRSGHPLAAMGPQVGYYSPEILVEYEIHAPGLHSSGMAFPGAAPYPLIGHTGEFAWSGTTANGDNADTFAEQLCEPGGGAATLASDAYLYKGKCTPFTHRDITLHTPLAPTTVPPATPKTFVLRTMRSVHGSVHDFATSAGKPYALVRSTAVSKHGIRGIVAFSLIAEGTVHSPQQFVATMRHYTGNENWFYVDSNHIGWLQSGWFPQHAPGTDLELPIKGTGAWDWKGFDATTSGFTRHADSFNPTAIDPKQGYLASWNNKGAREWRAAPGIWSYGSIHRDLLLRDPTVAAITAGKKLTLSDLVGISGSAATQDLRGVAVLPDLLKALGPVTDIRQKQLVTALQTWVARGAHRRSTTGATFDDDSAAVLLFDAWWRALTHQIYDPQLGADVVTELQGGINLTLDARAVAGGFYDGWHSQVADVVRSALGTGPHLTATHCGTGSLASCRALLRSAFTKATASVTASQGQSVAGWKKPVLCPDDTPTCDETRPVVAGAIATPAQPWQNRGTYHQAVEVLGPLDRVAAPPTAAPQGGLPATGGAPVLAGLAVLLLLCAAVSVRSWRSAGSRSCT